ncbi:hypothetical protein GLOTRDRAFT_75757 [Gloeophyllum trabeum ATCC 11539]|uniref:RING-type domain-containing protein n=1 Tax=Gloeophyllum trabeum (strain ATCC 11539 / FP-39264 / Madison 617) TaxID=670483 RepID=S7Q7V3_GLOTA|nr:uncharacterized protein GLOTRDRAFT_75757 [Gloeophyllum trabeum ATCC 11539]EPQ55612.1 hypothetical protein GLOTRDRAFT_75757 [Gloeophyllum trabeum ATCC 11539]
MPLFGIPRTLEGVYPDTLSAPVYRARSSFEAGPHEFLRDCYVLQREGRVELDGHLHMVVTPPSSWDSNEEDLPFQLRLGMTVSAITPTIFQSPDSSNYRKTQEVQESQRCALARVFRSPAPPASYHGSTDIPFFLSILGPAPAIDSRTVDKAAQPESLVPTLLPFQRRTLVWMLGREGKMINGTGRVVPKSNAKSERELPIFWEKVEIEPHAEPWYFRRLTGSLSTEFPDEDEPFGGILAEEPGLGKTVECIGLILLNPALPDRKPTNMWWNDEAKINVKEVKTTLIVTPASLAPQWIDELARHAPYLKVTTYDGWAKLKIPVTEAEAAQARKDASAKARQGKKKTGKKKKSNTDMDVDEANAEDEIVDWVQYVNKFDVVITTYNVLQQDLTVARPPPTRPRREIATYSNIERSRSPLIMCEWYRVIMDEVQMVGGGKTEEMVSLIPRLSSWAVSGTPARAQVSDLAHVLNFLRVDAAVASSRIWNTLLLPGYAHEFTSLFRRYAVRTTKAAVQAELTIPQQTRYLVPIELGRVERTVYDQTLQQALDELGLDSRGVAASEGWQVEPGLLRSWLRKLRGICTHPQVGQLQTTRDKLSKPGALKTMAEVLEGMRDQNWRTLMDNRKAKARSMAQTVLPQLQQHEEGNSTRYREALDTLLAAQQEAHELVEDMKAAIAAHDAKGALLKEEVLLRDGEGERGSSEQAEAADADASTSKGEARDREGSRTGLEDLDDDDLPRNAAGEEHAAKRRGLQHRLRECLLALHRVKFLLGDMYHVLGQSYSAPEDAAYAEAEAIRRNLLRNTEEAASRAMDQLALDNADKGVKVETLMVPVPYLGQGGIRSSELMNEANKIIGDLLNEQTQLLWMWRARIYTLLTQKLSGSDEATGQEYAQSLDAQGEAEAYLQAYAALMADRRESLVAERTVLNQDSAKEKKTRKTRTAQEAAENAEDIEEDVELQPEHEVLQKQLSEARNALRQKFTGRAVKSVMIDLNAVVARIPKNDDPEKALAKDAAKRLRQLISSQFTLIERLESDLALFRKAFNERILYFRQLQEISDSVAEPTWEGTVHDALCEARNAEKELRTPITTGKARQRYLEHLAKMSGDNSGCKDEDDEVCILCRCEFTRGYITQCAHMYCEGCMKAWLARKEGKACPVCRVMIDLDQLQRFSIGTDPKDRPAPPRIQNGEVIPTSRRPIRYNYIDPALFEEIEGMESSGSYGSKIQTLVRHVLHIQDTDPGAKSIVFSAWADSLHIVQHALLNNGIACLRIDQTKGRKNAAKRFADEPELLVLLLHGERENAGLNVTCASRVFMLESVVHHAFEIQAIARIDRMGQTRPTEVYCYYAEDTVERNILDLAARQGLSLYTEEKCRGALDPNLLAVEDGKVDKTPTKRKAQKQKQKGDFIFKLDDMLAILFPHMFEELEYLIPPEDDHSTAGQLSLSINRPSTTNAIAGPSRL